MNISDGTDVLYCHANSLSLCFWNVRSICNKIRSVLSYLSDNDVDIAFISETWLPNINCAQTHIINTESDYCIHHTIKPPVQGVGGVGFLMKKSLVTRPFKINQTFPSFEFSCISIPNPVSNSSEFAVLITIYRFHLNTMVPFFIDFDSFLNFLTLQASDVIVGGDFNIKLNNTSDPDTNKLIDLISEYGFIIFDVADYTHNNGNTLDFGFSSANLIDSVNSIHVDHNEDISDHFPVLIDLPISHPVVRPDSTIKPFLRRNLLHINTDSFTDDLSSTLDVNFSFLCSNFHDQLLSFNSSLLSCINNHAPLTEIKPKNVNHPKWFDREYILAR